MIYKVQILFIVYMIQISSIFTSYYLITYIIVTDFIYIYLYAGSFPGFLVYSKIQ